MTNEQPQPRVPVHARAAGLVPPEHRVERAAGDLRRGVPVLIRGDREDDSAIALAAETTKERTLTVLVGRFGAPLSVLTHDRAATLKIRLYTPSIVVVPQHNTV